jgi:hypothetical protein
MRNLLIATSVALLALSSPLVADDKPAAPSAAVAPITSLAFLEGTWVGTMEGERFEASYSSPAGGKMVSWSKGFAGPKVEFFELEVFEERKGTLVVTPFPDGKRAASFTLASLEGEKAVFVNPKNPFPREIVYSRVSKDELLFLVSGEQGGQKVVWRFELTRSRR